MAKGGTYMHFKPRSLQFEQVGLVEEAAAGRSLRSQRTLTEIREGDTRFMVGDVPSHPASAARGELLAGGLGLTGGATGVRSGSGGLWRHGGR
jgi:hypothetical protein